MLPSLDDILNALGWGVLLPAAVATAGLLLAGRTARAGRIAALLAVAGAFLAGWIALAATKQISWNFLEPSDCWDWLPGLTLLACAARFFDYPPSLRHLLRLSVALLTGWLLVKVQFHAVPVPAWWFVAAAVVVTVLWELLDALARVWPGLGLAALLALIAFAAAVVIEFAGFGSLAQMAGVLAGVLTGCAIAGKWRPRANLAPAAAAAVAVQLPGLLFATYCNTFSDVPLTSYLLIIAAAAALGVTAASPFARVPATRLVIVRVAVVLLPLVVALALAAQS
jgi:hypothetical protein